MREWNNIEKQMKTVVDAHESKAPEFIWAAIENELNNSGRKGIAWLPVLGLAALAIASIFVINTLVSQKSNNKKNENQEKVMFAENSKADSEDETKELMAGLSEEKDAELNFLTASPSVSLSAEQDIETNETIETVKKSFVRKRIEPTHMQESVSATDRISNTNSFVKPFNEASDKVQIKNNDVTSYKSNTLVSSLSPILTSIPLLDNKREIVEYTDGIECPSFSNSISIHPFIELNGLLGYHVNSLIAKSNGETNGSVLAENRRTTESSWYNWGGQVHLGLNVNRNIYIGTGLEWSQHKDKFKFEDAAITKIIIDLDPEGNPIDTNLVSGMFVSTGEVKYNMLDIPVFVGVNRSIGTWDIGFEGSALFNLSFSSNGKIINEQFEVERTESGTTVHKDRLGLGLRGSIVLRKFLNDGLSFHLKPTYKTYLCDLNHETYPVRTKVNIFRLDFGFRKDF